MKLKAFLGHSFDDKDQSIILKIKKFLNKLNIEILSGEKPAASLISNKVKKRIDKCDIFIGIFTRRKKIESTNIWTTSPWIIDEKGYAIAKEKPLLLFVESGIKDIGGLQGDYEHIKFDRENITEILINSIPYVLDIQNQMFLASIRKEKYEANLVNAIHPNLIIYKSRRETTNALTAIVENAQKDDILFGHCRLCSDYPKEFYSALKKVVSRGVFIRFIAFKNPDSMHFIKNVLSLNTNYTMLKISDQPYIRIFGIKDKEVIIAIPFAEGYFGFHFKDERVSTYFWPAFEKIWDASEVYYPNYSVKKNE